MIIYHVSVKECVNKNDDEGESNYEFMTAAGNIDFHARRFIYRPIVPMAFLVQQESGHLVTRSI